MSTKRKLGIAGAALTSLAASAAMMTPGSAATDTSARADDPNRKVWNIQTNGCMTSESADPASWVEAKYNCTDGDPYQVWEFHHVEGSLYQIRLPYAAGSDDLCLSVEGHEGGDTHIGDRVRLEGCERDDALWWFDQVSSDTFKIRNYVNGHADLALQVDPGDDIGDRNLRLGPVDGGDEGGDSVTWAWYSA